ncbi:MAG: type I glyceraldehyde-3-phosphate dehydrogenase [Deltaproteobacteria bacterium]|nr:type I glyceraldehyde-3-phosphate dehydrogenase [Deltaproteobacteria bacterium]
MAKVAINGLGRIGRVAFRILVDRPDLELVAANDLVDPDDLAYLIQFDSVHGRFPKPIRVDGKHLVVDGTRCQVLNEKDPAALPWGELGVDLVFECTGFFDTREALEKHLQAGAKRVILSAPAQGPGVPTVVHGVNRADPAERIISCASCTTNCVTPVVEVLDRRIGVLKAMMSTTHAYTSTQKLLDTALKNPRRGRSAAVNLVPASTGAARATAKVLPKLAGKFDGLAIRAPVPSGSIALIVLLTARKTSVEEVNRILREEAETERYRDILAVAEAPLVSSDVLGDCRASIVDAEMTQVVDGDLVQVASWYDNEWGYACQMIKEGARILKEAATAQRLAA